MRILLSTILLFVFLSSCSNGDQLATLEATNASLTTEVETLQGALASAEQAASYRPGMIHSVFFWLKEDLTEAQLAAFRKGLYSLADVPSTSGVYIGPPEVTENRFVVDDSYDYALLIHFDDLAAHDAYQVDPIHQKFVETHAKDWSKVVVYDSSVKTVDGLR